MAGRGRGGPGGAPGGAGQRGRGGEARGGRGGGGGGGGDRGGRGGGGYGGGDRGGRGRGGDRGGRGGGYAEAGDRGGAGRGGGRGGEGGGRGGYGGGGRGGYGAAQGEPAVRVVAPARYTRTAGADAVFGRPPLPDLPDDAPTFSIAVRPKQGGTKGRRMPLLANLYPMVITRLAEKAFHYDVVVTPDLPMTKLRKALVAQCHNRPEFYGIRCVFDGKNLFAAREFPQRDFAVENVTLPDEESRPVDKRRKFTVVVKKVADVALAECVRALLKVQPINETNRVGMQMLDIAVRYSMGMEPNRPIGRAIFYPSIPDRIKPLGECACLWVGDFAGIKPTQSGLLLNVDTAAVAMIDPVPILDYLEARIKGWSRRGPMSPAMWNEAYDLVRGLKIAVTHMGQHKRQYRIKGLADVAATDDKFEDDETLTVALYFAEKYFRLQHPHLPCLKASNGNSLPMEVCAIVPGQRVKNMLSAEQRTRMLDATSAFPAEKRRQIENATPLKVLPTDSFLQEFGLELKPGAKMVSLNGRLLLEPMMLYKDQQARPNRLQPKNGSWALNPRICLLQPGTPSKGWCCINWAAGAIPLRPAELEQFLLDLTAVCKGMGIKSSGPPKMYGGNPRDIPDELKRIMGEGPFSLVMCVLANEKCQDQYAEIKQICDVEYGIPTQCFNGRTLMNSKKSGYFYQVNVAHKINAKLGGTNHQADGPMPGFDQHPTLIVGADVHHPPPNDTTKPSIAALVGSYDRTATKYATITMQQVHRQEVITGMQPAMVNLLRYFYKENNNTPPKRIVIYRDGVGETQFQEIMRRELLAIKRACVSINENYKPAITFIIMQKRHKTRLFATQPGDMDKDGNLLAGTVVDTAITHMHHHDFYLCSHGGLKGTSKPTHYHVAYDECGFTPDQLQDLTFRLCHVYQRCARSVSMPAPVYYAHLAAYRARLYKDGGANPVLKNVLWYV